MMEMAETLSYNENEIRAVFKGGREDEVMLLHELAAEGIPVYSFGRDRSRPETLFMLPFRMSFQEVKEHLHMNMVHRNELLMSQPDPCRYLFWQ